MQSHVCLERRASSRRICAVTRGFQTTTQDLSVFPFLPRHHHYDLCLSNGDSNTVLLSPFTTTVFIPVILAILNIILVMLKMFITMTTAAANE